MVWTKEQRHDYNIKWRSEHPDYDRNRIRDNVLRRKYAQSYRQRHLDKVKAKQQRIKLEVLKHYSHGLLKCLYCGESNFRKLTLDHINNDGKQHRKSVKSGTQVYYWAKANGFPPIFQVLCYRCNTRKAKLDQKCKYNKKDDCNDCDFEGCPSWGASVEPEELDQKTEDNTK